MDPTAGQMTLPCLEMRDEGKWHSWSSCTGFARRLLARLSLDNTWHDFVLMARDLLCSFRGYLDKLYDSASILASERRRAE